MKPREFKRFLRGLGQLNQTQRSLVEETLRDLDEDKPVADLINNTSIGLKCPHCDCESLQKWGIVNQLQRYRCKACRRTFNRLTHTPFSRLRQKEKWVGAIHSIQAKDTIVQMSERLNVNPKTAFRWRHRFLKGFSGNTQPILGGIVEADETFFRTSEKGARHLDRKARKRGEKAKTRGLSLDEFVTVWIARDRNKRTLHQVSHHRDAYFVKQLLGNRIQPDSILCTDGKKGYATFAKTHKVQHVALNLSLGERIKDSVYHIQNVNNYHARLKNWISHFNGISSKYLENYLEWFRLRANVSEGLVPFNPHNFLKMAILNT